MFRHVFRRSALGEILLVAGLIVFGSSACDSDKKTEVVTKDAGKDSGSDSGSDGADSGTMSTGCTFDFTSQEVDGKALWQDIPDASTPKNCNFHRLAYNNFLYMVGGPSATPRFMTELASTSVLAASGSWPNDPKTFAPRKLTNLMLGGESPAINSDEDAGSPFSNGQAGDGFELLDVANLTVEYEIRVNRVWWDYVKANNLTNAAGIQAATDAFNLDPHDGGVWFPPNGDTEKDAIETKTSWRDFGTAASACPKDIMYCQKDSAGHTWGLLAMHFVQKTPTRGEMIWASFEHVANSPDCDTGYSNPLQENPRDPTAALGTSPTTATININKNISALSKKTGWNVFDFDGYGGDGETCVYPQGTFSSTTCVPDGNSDALCNLDPTDGMGGYKRINVCRTDPIPDHSTVQSAQDVCKNTSDNDDNVACITQSVLDNWPSSLSNVWKYYLLIGTQWMDATSVPTVGCFEYDDGPKGINDVTCPDSSVPYDTFPITGTVALANTTMETWMQEGMCQEYNTQPDSEIYHQQNCFTCHTPKTQSFGAGDLSHGLIVFAGD